MFNWLASFLSRFSMLINYTIWSSNLFFCIRLFPAFFIVQNFQSPDFSRSRFFRVQFFWVQVFLGPGCSGSTFFRAQVQGLGSGFIQKVFKLILCCDKLNAAYTERFVWYDQSERVNCKIVTTFSIQICMIRFLKDEWVLKEILKPNKYHTNRFV